MVTTRDRQIHRTSWYVSAVMKFFFRFVYWRRTPVGHEEHTVGAVLHYCLRKPVPQQENCHEPVLSNSAWVMWCADRTWFYSQMAMYCRVVTVSRQQIICMMTSIRCVLVLLCTWFGCTLHTMRLQGLLEIQIAKCTQSSPEVRLYAPQSQGHCVVENEKCFSRR